MATALGTGSPQNLWGLSPYGGQTMGSFPGQGIGGGQPYTQQIVQSLQTVPQQLHQLQHQLLQLQQLQHVQQQYLQQLLQVLPVQLQQLQQLVQFIPQQIQQLQQPFGQLQQQPIGQLQQQPFGQLQPQPFGQLQQPFGLPIGMTGLPFQQTSTLSPFAGQSVM